MKFPSDLFIIETFSTSSSSLFKNSKVSRKISSFIISFS